ncbi:peptidoglycan DD-metalloendopeptidase family protein [Sphingobium lignivorans]|uniref:Murein DD-endopeptidase MepM/ murein hydrolase activator NlpD n=1 Tax=Sphingobium lignivorans TaxID=2735886 RepID=A0ABR6NJE8_9SPHN|nr:murein DD-endopeptidase MepM/ murein hydrolase activator NlpD [Sphingobium lignivorans]
MFQKIEFNPHQGASIGTLWLNSPARVPAPALPVGWQGRIGDWANRVELVPDLGSNIGSRVWWRGLFTCVSLCGTTLMLSPGMPAIPGSVPTALGANHLDHFRSQMISASALGGDSGLRMGPTDAVAPLAETPERPQIELNAALGTGDSFAHTLARSGVSDKDASAVLALVAQAVDPESIAAGTRVQMILGRRPNRNVARPLERLSVRARLELALEIHRQDGALTLRRIPIAVDNTPLRIRGRVGGSLYRAARAAGAAPSTIQAYLKVLASQVSVGSLRAEDRFDIIVAHRRAETGEAEVGQLLFAGLERARGKDINMLKWTQDGRQQWFEASGVGERRGVLAAPVSGRMSSNYGQRFHPILGYKRMHAGVDFSAAHGSPIYAVTDGRVNYAGWHGGHGKYVRLQHAGGIGSGYAHMSRIAVKSGQSVRRGQVIGYVGSTGLSTGPHLHYELYRNGATVNPGSIKFTQVAQLSGSALAAFKAKIAELKRLPAGPVAERTAQATPAPTDNPAGGGVSRTR